MTRNITAMLDSMPIEFLKEFVAVAPSRIALIREPSEELQLVAVKADHHALRYLKNPTDAVYETAIFGEDGSLRIPQLQNCKSAIPEHIQNRIIDSPTFNIWMIRNITMSARMVALALHRWGEGRPDAFPTTDEEWLWARPNNYLLAVLFGATWDTLERSIYDDYISQYHRAAFLRLKARYGPMRQWFYA